MFEDLIGCKFGKWTILSYEGKDSSGKHVLKCICGCGTENNVRYRSLKDANSTQCFKCGRKQGHENCKTHGLKNTPEYCSWTGMRNRCLNKKNINYKRYGGRGIHLCKEWIDDFKSFYNHVGKKPTPSHTIDRIDNERGYEPGNVRWATKSEQILNRRYWKLTDVQVQEIRERYSRGNITQKQLGEEYGVTRVTIGDIIRGKTWKHLRSNHV